MHDVRITIIVEICVNRGDRIALVDDSGLLTYCDELAVWEGERKRILGDRKSSADDKRSLLANLDAEPEAPPIPILTSTEPTWEGLVKQLDKGYPSQGMYSSEGGSSSAALGCRRTNG